MIFWGFYTILLRITEWDVNDCHSILVNFTFYQCKITPGILIIAFALHYIFFLILIVLLPFSVLFLTCVPLLQVKLWQIAVIGFWCILNQIWDKLSFNGGISSGSIHCHSWCLVFTCRTDTFNWCQSNLLLTASAFLVENTSFELYGPIPHLFALTGTPSLSSLFVSHRDRLHVLGFLISWLQAVWPVGNPGGRGERVSPSRRWHGCSPSVAPISAKQAPYSPFSTWRPLPTPALSYTSAPSIPIAPKSHSLSFLYPPFL